MKRGSELENLTKSYYRLFDITRNPIFGTACFYMRRTGYVVKLPAMKEDNKTDDLSL